MENERVVRREKLENDGVVMLTCVPPSGVLDSMHCGLAVSANPQLAFV